MVDMRRLCLALRPFYWKELLFLAFWTVASAIFCRLYFVPPKFEKLAIPVVSQHDNAYYFNKFFYLDVDQALPMCYDFDAPMLSELVYLPDGLIMACDKRKLNKCIGLNNVSKTTALPEHSLHMRKIQQTNFVLPNGDIMLLGFGGSVAVVRPGIRSYAGPEFPINIDLYDFACATVINDTTAIVIANETVVFYSITNDTWSIGPTLSPVSKCKDDEFASCWSKHLIDCTIIKDSSDTMLLLSSAGCVGGCNGTIEVIDSQISLLRVPEITNDTLYSNNSSNATIPDKATWQSSAVVLGKKGELYNLTCHELNCSWDLLPWNLVTSNSSIRSSLSEVLPWLIKCPEVPPQQWSFKWRPIDRKTQAYHTHYHNDKILVAGGLSEKPNITITNVGRNITCQDWGTDWLWGLEYATGGVVLDHRTGNETPIICGGYWQLFSTEVTKCYALQPTGGIEVVAQMKTARMGAASIVVNGSLFVTGGLNDTSVELNTSEIITLGGQQASISGPLLPEPMSRHCFVKLNQSHAVAITWSGSVYLYDIGNQTWTRLQSVPFLGSWNPFFRAVPLCGQLKDSTWFEPIIIVIDGLGNVYHAIFRRDDGFAWYDGPQPDFEIDPIRARVVTSSNGRNLFFMGLSGKNRNEMHQMGCTRRECIWQPMIESMTDFRRESFAMIVPDELTECTDPPLDILGVVFCVLFVVTMALPCIFECRIF